VPAGPAKTITPRRTITNYQANDLINLRYVALRLGRTLHVWRDELVAHFDHPNVSNGPTENLNLKIKNTKRIARGYRNFAHYRLRLLLNHGLIHEDHSPTRIRTRTLRFAA